MILRQVPAIAERLMLLQTWQPAIVEMSTQRTQARTLREVLAV
jgi:hypothetical protein